MEPVTLLEANDAGKILGLSPSMVRFLANEGRLPLAAKTTSGRRLFHPKDVAALASKRQRERAKAKKNGNGGAEQG